VRGVPLQGHVGISDGGPDGEVQLARDASIGGVPCSAQASVRFELGKLVECRLSRPARIDGIPCVGSVELSNGVVCTLASDYARFGVEWRAQTKITDYGDLVWFAIGPIAPNLMVLNAPLPAGSEVQFAYGQIASVDRRTNPVSFGGCKIGLILVTKGKVTGQIAGACDMPEARTSSEVPLPSTALRRENAR
jgi:hypothetical protein